MSAATAASALEQQQQVSKRPKRESTDDKTPGSGDVTTADADTAPAPEAGNAEPDEAAMHRKNEQSGHSADEKPTARKRRLEFEQLYLDALPCAALYERSFMHRDLVTHVAVARDTQFVLTASRDGHVKFWKKEAAGLEFVRDFRAHSGPVQAVALSRDGRLLATAGGEGSVKLYDVAAFDLTATCRLAAGVLEWVPCAGRPAPLLAAAVGSAIRLFDAGGQEVALLPPLHTAPVAFLRYSPAADAVVSLDAAGHFEFWSTQPAADGSWGAWPARLAFRYKIDTDLYALVQQHVVAISVAVSEGGELLAAFCSDRCVRIWHVLTGRLHRVYDETLAQITALQKSGPTTFQLDEIDFGRRVAVEKELWAALLPRGPAGPCAASADVPAPGLAFDASGRFLLYPTLLGIKVVNVATNRLARILGKLESTERFHAIALFQGRITAGSHQQQPQFRGSSAAAAADPTVVLAAYKKQRFYLFTRREPADTGPQEGGRDVFNEKPTTEHATAPALQPAALAHDAVLHTTLGDIFLKLFPAECPKTVENFATHARSGYYNNVLFHRVIKGFMIQTGDPSGDGTGGESIWGHDFEDEFHRALKHDRPGTVSMANTGQPNSNGSQFFITTVELPKLDQKHTVFGRITKGMDVVTEIEKSKIDADDKPLKEVRIVSITVT